MKGVIRVDQMEIGEGICWAEEIALAKAQRYGKTWHCLKIESGSLWCEDKKHGKCDWKQNRNIS